MDPQSMLISAAVTVVSAVVIYLIYACGMRERTYEEVMAEQRRLHQSEFLTGKKSDKKEKVKKKKKPKAEKVAVEEVVAPEEPELVEEVIEEPPRESTPPPELEESLEEGEIPPTPPPQPKSTGKKRKDKRVVREEPAVVEAPVKREVVQEVKAVKQHVEKVKETKVTSSKKVSQLEMEMNLEAQILTESKPMKEREGKKNKKNKANIEQVQGDSLKSVVNLQLMQSIRTSVLNDQEIQAIIDILLNKQGVSAPTIEWTKDKKSQKGDPTALLKKQLEEKEIALADEQRAAAVAQGKLKELKSELSGERQRYVALEKNSQEKVGTQQAEIMALHARMQSSHTQHNQEIHTLRQQVDALNGAMSGAANNKQLQQLADENRKLKETAMKAGDVANIQQQNKFLQEQLNNAMTKVATTENVKKSLEKRMEDQIRKLDSQKREAETVLSQKLSEVNRELELTHSHNANLGRDLEQTASAKTQIEQEMVNLRNQIKTLETDTKSMEALRDLQVKVETLSQENAMLVSELQTTRERTAGEGQESEAAEPIDEKAGTMTDLQTELEEKLSEIKQLSQELDAQKQKNNTLREKNYKVMDALKNAEKMAETAMNKKEEKPNHELQAEMDVVRVEAITPVQSAPVETSWADSAEETEEMKSQITELTSKVTAATEEALKAKSTVDALQKELVELQNKPVPEVIDTEAFTKQIAELTAERDALLQAKPEEPKVDTEAFTKQIEELTAERNALLQTKSEEPKVDTEVFTKQVADLTAERDALLQKTAGDEETAAKVDSLQAQLDAAAAEKQAVVCKLEEQLAATQQDAAEINSLKAELEAAKNSTGEIDTLKAELENSKKINEAMESLKSELESAKAASAEVETLKTELESSKKAASEVEQLKSELESAKSAAGEIEALKADLEKAKEALVVATGKNTEADSRDDESESDVLKRELEEKRKAYAEASRQVSSLGEELEAVKIELSEKEAGTGSVTAAAGDAPSLSELEELRKQLETARAELERLKSDLDAAQQAATESEKVYKADKEAELLRFQAVQTQLELLKAKQEEQAAAPPAENGHGKAEEEVMQLKEELTIVKKENHELRAGCEVATKKLTEAEKSADELAEMQAQLKAKVTEVERLRDALNSKEQELEQVSSIPGSPARSASPNPELLKRLFPEAKIKSDMSEEEWASTFEQEAKKYMEKSKAVDNQEDLDSKLKASQAAQAKLQAQVQHYKTVLADTEGILNKLQSSVESEEKKWQQRTIDEVNRVKEEYSQNSNQSMANGSPSHNQTQQVKEASATAANSNGSAV